MKTINILMFIFGVILISIFPISLYSLATSPTHEEETKCYDKYSNEIEGLICYDTVFDNELVETLIDWMPIFLILFFLGIALIILSIEQ